MIVLEVGGDVYVSDGLNFGDGVIESELNRMVSSIMRDYSPALGDSSQYVVERLADAGIAAISLSEVQDEIEIDRSSCCPVQKSASDCGANAPGGGGFQLGNTCAASKGGRVDQTKSRAFKKWFGKSKVVDESGKPQVVYHGSRRPDRIGSEFREDRATSGPMAFFTDNATVASNYAESKADTSLESVSPDDPKTWIINGHQLGDIEGDKPFLRNAWRSLPASERVRLKKLLPKAGMVDFDPDGPVDFSGEFAPNVNHFEFVMEREHGGDAIAALFDVWAWGSADLEGFEKILQAAGVPYVHNDPHQKNPGVFPVFLAIENPLDTANISEELIEKLEDASLEAGPPESYGADAWDKNTRDPEDWVSQLKEDTAAGENSFVWTSIPDWVTEALKKEGYDGIKDTGGKMGGEGHVVWIPFRSDQVKSAIGNSGKFDKKKTDITKSLSKSSGCGANAPGGGGFQPGNTCASGKQSQSSSLISKDADDLILEWMPSPKGAPPSDENYLYNDRRIRKAYEAMKSPSFAFSDEEWLRLVKHEADRRVDKLLHPNSQQLKFDDGEEMKQNLPDWLSEQQIEHARRNTRIRENLRRAASLVALAEIGGPQKAAELIIEAELNPVDGNRSELAYEFYFRGAFDIESTYKKELLDRIDSLISKGHSPSEVVEFAKSRGSSGTSATYKEAVELANKYVEIVATDMIDGASVAEIEAMLLGDLDPAVEEVIERKLPMARIHALLKDGERTRQQQMENDARLREQYEQVHARIDEIAKAASPAAIVQKYGDLKAEDRDAVYQLWWDSGVREKLRETSEGFVDGYIDLLRARLDRGMDIDQPSEDPMSLDALIDPNKKIKEYVRVHGIDAVKNSSVYNDAVDRQVDNAGEVEWDRVPEDERISIAKKAGIVQVEEIANLEPFDSDHHRYAVTSVVAKAIQSQRTRELFTERLRAINPELAGNEEFVDRILKDVGTNVWSAWKTSSTSNYGKALQLAAVEEFGVVGKPEYIKDRDQIIESIEYMYEDGLAYEALKAHARATWEATQYVLEKAGVERKVLWRGLKVNVDLGEVREIKATREEIIEHLARRAEVWFKNDESGDSKEEFMKDYWANYANDEIIDNWEQSQSVQFRKLPGLRLLRNGVASTTSLPSVANGWGGTGDSPRDGKRVVIRIDASREDILSIPAFGANIQSEQEVLVLGSQWNRWDAWLDKAPEVDDELWDEEDGPQEKSHAIRLDDGTVVIDMEPEGEPHWLSGVVVNEPMMRSMPDIRDGDGDGFIYDGTEHERAAPPKKGKEDHQKNRAGAVIKESIHSDDGDTAVYVLTAEKDGQQVGWMQLTINREYEQALADTIVDDEFQRQGIATDLYVEAAKLARLEGAYLEPNNAEVSPEAAAIWESFRRRGWSDGYSFTEIPDAAGSKQASQVDTPEFRNWFGRSKAVDELGKPKVFYHGGKFGTEGDKVFANKNSPPLLVADEGFFFTDDPELASWYAGSDAVTPVYLRVEKPYVLPTGESVMGLGRDSLKQQGYDGWVAQSGSEWVVFDPDQVKSAIGNSGKFDKKKTDITKSLSKSSGCGANAPGGGGFQRGNDCAKGGSRFKYDMGRWEIGEDPRGLSPDHVAYSPDVRWVQEHESALRDAVESWVGSPSVMRLHIRDFLNGSNAHTESGSGKVMRAQAEALLKEVVENSRPAPVLYRGDNKPPEDNTSELLGWTESIKEAKKWAKKYGGKVYMRRDATGIRIRDVPGVRNTFGHEMEWIVPHNMPSVLMKSMTKSSDCGANAPGGGGFQPGNTCASVDSKAGGQQERVEKRRRARDNAVKQLAEVKEENKKLASARSDAIQERDGIKAELDGWRKRAFEKTKSEIAKDGESDFEVLVRLGKENMDLNEVKEKTGPPMKGTDRQKAIQQAADRIHGLIVERSKSEVLNGVVAWQRGVGATRIIESFDEVKDLLGEEALARILPELHESYKQAVSEVDDPYQYLLTVPVEMLTESEKYALEIDERYFVEKGQSIWRSALARNSTEPEDFADKRKRLQELSRMIDMRGQFPGPNLAMEREIENRIELIDKTMTPEFERWFGDSVTVDEEGVPLVIYHGTEESGFEEFDDRRDGDVFGSTDISLARTYSGGYADDVTPTLASSFEEMVGRLEDHRFAVEYGNDAVGYYESKDDAIEEIERQKEKYGLEDDEVKESYVLYDKDGSRWYESTEKDLVLDVYNTTPALRDTGPGVYPLFFRMKDVYEIDAKDANWDSIPMGDDTEDEEGAYTMTTNEIASEARGMGYDGVIIRNVNDHGGGSGLGYGDVYIALDPGNIKSVHAESFEEDPNILKSLGGKPDIRDGDGDGFIYDGTEWERPAPKKDKWGERLDRLNRRRSGKERQTDTPEFRRWFGDSKIVGEDGDPLVVYHGSADVFTEFRTDMQLGDDRDRAAFFSSSPDVAEGYANGMTLDEKQSLHRINQLHEEKDSLTRDLFERNNRAVPSSERSTVHYLNEMLDSGEVTRSEYDRFHKLADGIWDYDNGEAPGSQKRPNVKPVYLKIENPLVIDAEGLPWDYIVPIGLQEADRTRHDGIIWNNLQDSAKDFGDYSANTYAVFRPDQIKSAIGNDGTFDHPSDITKSLYRSVGAVSDCGANAPGGGGFQPGNTCASGGGGQATVAAAEDAIASRKARIDELVPLRNMANQKVDEAMDEYDRVRSELGDSWYETEEGKAINQLLIDSRDKFDEFKNEILRLDRDIKILSLGKDAGAEIQTSVEDGIDVDPEIARSLAAAIVKRPWGDESPWVAARWRFVLENHQESWSDDRYEFRIEPIDEPEAVPDGAMAEVPPRDGYVYRGMSREEWDHSIERGHIQSLGSHNLGQEGLTFYGDADTAGYYARGFAPFAFQPSIKKPSVVIEIPRSMVMDHSEHPEIPSSEFAHKGPLDLSHVTRVYDVVPSKIRAGSIEVVYRDGKISEGSRMSPSVSAVIVPAKLPSVAGKKENTKTKSIVPGGNWCNRHDMPGIW